MRARGFRNVVLWSRGVDTALFHPRVIDLCLPAPVFLCVGRVAVEKNLEAFLELDLPGTKLVVGDGPARRRWSGNIRTRCFSAPGTAKNWRRSMPRADVFVFPSKTDTFGLVLLEALASGLPVAAFPVTGPRDVIGAAPVGVLNDDLRRPAWRRWLFRREACVAFAAGHTWQASARVFVDHATNAAPLGAEDERGRIRRGRPAFRRLISR